MKNYNKTTLIKCVFSIVIWVAAIQLGNSQSTPSILVDTIAIDSLSTGDTIRMVDGVNVDEVKVLKEFEATLIDASAVKFIPEQPIVTTRNNSYLYDITIIPLSLEYPDPIIKPYAMPKDPEISQYHYYFEGGYGNLKNPSAKLGFSKIDGDKYTVAGLLSFDALDNTQKVDLQKYQDIDVNIDSKVRIGENHQLGIGFDADIAQRFLYSTAVSINAPDPDLFNRDFNDFGVHASYGNIESTNGFNYSGQINGGLLSFANDDINEQRFGLEGEASKSINSYSTARLSLIMNTAIINNISHNDVNNYMLQACPSYHIQKKSWWAKAGMDIVLDQNISSIWPSAEVGVSIAKQRIQIFVGADQISQLNSLNSAMQNVPFLHTSVDSISSTINKRLYGGVRGNLGLIQYEGTVSYNDVDNHQFYNPNFVRFFEIEQIYDDVKRIEINGSVKIAIEEWVSIGGRVSQRIFDLGAFEEAWGIPEFELSAYGELSLLEQKLTIRPELFFANRVDYQLREETGSLNELFDVSVEARYKLKEAIGIYARGLNLLDNEYRQWFGYPTVGLQLQAGFWLKF